MAKREIMKEAKSVSRCAASVAMASELARNPPAISIDMKRRQRMLGGGQFSRHLEIQAQNCVQKWDKFWKNIITWSFQA